MPLKPEYVWNRASSVDYTKFFIFMLCSHGSKHGLDTKVDWLMTVSCTATWIMGGMAALCVVTVSDTSRSSDRHN